MGMYLDLDDVVVDNPVAKAELAALREQLRLANIDAANNEAEANVLRAERDKLTNERDELKDDFIEIKDRRDELMDERDDLQAELARLVEAIDAITSQWRVVSEERDRLRAALITIEKSWSEEQSTETDSEYKLGFILGKYVCALIARAALKEEV